MDFGTAASPRADSNLSRPPDFGATDSATPASADIAIARALTARGSAVSGRNAPCDSSSTSGSAAARDSASTATASAFPGEVAFNTDSTSAAVLASEYFPSAASTTGNSSFNSDVNSSSVKSA